MKKLVCLGLLVLLMGCGSFASENIAKYENYAYLISCQNEEVHRDGKKYIVTGKGSASAIDLNSLGLGYKILTAAHVIEGDSNEIFIKGKDGNQYKCKVFWKDIELDVCLLDTEYKCPEYAKLSTSNWFETTEELVTVQCPEGSNPFSTSSKFIKREKRNIDYYLDCPKFFHGSSGASIFNPKTGLIMGVCLAGLSDGKGSDMIRGTALFLPAFRILQALK